jgi:16S rRNA (uracil1498-N3)-methyltransferase
MSRRYFLETPIANSTATLTGDEAKHLTKVLRATPGDRVTLFAGDGLEHQAEIVEVSKSAVTFTVLESCDVSRESPRAVHVAVALPKGDRQRYLIEKCVELGVAKVVPLIAERSVAQPTDNALERCRRYVIEASKQCGRNLLMEIAPLCRAADFWPQHSRHAYISHPSALSETDVNVNVEAMHVAAIHVSIGPEGGFTDEEVAAAEQAGWQRLSLGPRILRVETAALAVAARFCS